MTAASPIALDAPTPDAADRYHAALRPFWHPVATVEQVGERPLGVRLLGEPLTLVRLEGAIRCFDEVCRHLGASLSLGQVVDGTLLRCMYHGWTYDGTGRCVEIPSRGGAAVPSEARVRAYAVRERYGLVWVCLEDTPVAEIPAFPEFDDPAFRVTSPQMYEPWAASAPRLVLGALDDTHFPWVHPGVIGDPRYPAAPQHEAWREDDRVVATYVRKRALDGSFGIPDDAPGYIEIHRTAMCTPTTIRLVMRYVRVGDEPSPAGSSGAMFQGTHVMFEAASPVSHDRSVPFIILARDTDLDPEHDEVYLASEHAVQAQDRPIIESQRPWLLPPLSSRLLLYVRPDDLPLVTLQRWLEELGVPQV